MRSSRTLRIAAAVALVVAGALMVMEILAIGVAEVAVDRQLGSIAYRFRPTNARAAALYAETMLAANRLANAERLAKAGIAASPIEVIAIRTLGQARNARTAGAGHRLMLHAGHFGWRDRPTQLWLIERAVLAGEVDIALARAEAMVRLQRDRELVFALLRMLAMSRENRHALVRSLAQNPFWRAKFLAPDTTTSYPQLASMALLLEELDRTANPPTIADARYTIDGLAQAGHMEEAGRLHARLFPQRGENLIFDGDFERGESDYRAGSGASAFDWVVSESDRSAAAVERDGGQGGHVLYAVSDGLTGGRIAYQTRALPPGSYRISYRMRSDNLRAPERLLWTIRCATGSPVLLQSGYEPLRTTGWERRVSRFAVPAGCAGQVVELNAIPAAASQPSVANFDDVTIRRLD